MLSNYIRIVVLVMFLMFETNDLQFQDFQLYLVNVDHQHLNIAFCSLWANPSLGVTIRNDFKEWLKNQKWPNHFLGPFFKKKFTTINYFSSYVYPLHALIYGLKVILEF